MAKGRSKKRSKTRRSTKKRSKTRRSTKRRSKTRRSTKRSTKKRSKLGHSTISALTRRAGSTHRDFDRFQDEARQNDPVLIRLNRRLDDIMEPYRANNSAQLNNPARLSDMERNNVEGEYDRVLEEMYQRELAVDRASENRWRASMERRLAANRRGRNRRSRNRRGRSTRRKKSVRKSKRRKWNPDGYKASLPDRCFMLRKERKYPVCSKNGKISMLGLNAAEKRARLVANTGRVNTRSRSKARKVLKKIKKIKKSMGK